MMIMMMMMTKFQEVSDHLRDLQCLWPLLPLRVPQPMKSL